MHALSASCTGALWDTMAGLALLLALTAQAAAAVPLPPDNIAGSTASIAAEQVARAAQLLRGDATVAAALRLVNVGPLADEYAYYEDHDSDPTETGSKVKPRPAAPSDRENPAPAADTATPAADSDPTETGAKEKPRSAAPATEQALAALGFATALDLRLLAGDPEAAELMTELRTGGKLSIADRAKIRLLVGDAAHLARVSVVSSSHPSGTSSATAAGQKHDDQEGERAALRHSRQLQEDGGSGRGALSADTLAVVFSVSVGVCGYLFQAWTSDRANRHAADLQREHDHETRDQQVGHDRAQAQIRRTERWVDDFCSPMGRFLVEYSVARLKFGEYHYPNQVVLLL
eukprot:SAG22_NODE_76_length_22248_cov_14.352070_11_plen_347_part_00